MVAEPQFHHPVDSQHGPQGESEGAREREGTLVVFPCLSPNDVALTRHVLSGGCAEGCA